VNAALVLSACVAVLQIGIGVLLFSVARAPGWRSARVFAVIALSAAGYSAANLTSTYFPLDDSVRLWGSQFSFLMAAIFVASWLVNALGDGSGSLRALPRWAGGLATLCLTFGVLAVATPWLFVPGGFTEIDIPWARVRYRFASPSALGEVATYVFLVGILVTCVAFAFRRGATRRVKAEYVLGFSIFFVASTMEMLVSTGRLQFPFLADIGFLAVVVPMAAETVRRFIDDARRLAVASSHLSQEIEIRTQERDEAQSAWMEAERSAALGRLAAGVGHEINNPLAYLRLNVELIGEWSKDNGAPEELTESVESALDGADRIRRVVDALRAYSRPGTGVMVPLAPELITQAALRVAAHQLRDAGTVRTTFESAPAVLGDEGRLVQVMVNLLLNAAQAIAESRKDHSGVIDVRVGTGTEGTAVIEVRDNGPGITRDDLRRLTEPYFTTRAHAGAMGLGLFLARGVIEQLGGTLEIESAVGDGTLVRVVLPRAEQAPSSALESLAGRVLTPLPGVGALPAREGTARR
jgi:signal transduction histidine kinase